MTNSDLFFGWGRGAIKDIVDKKKMLVTSISPFPRISSKIFLLSFVKLGLCGKGLNPLPHMPVLGSSNSAANKDMMSKIWTNGDTIT